MACTECIAARKIKWWISKVCTGACSCPILWWCQLLCQLHAAPMERESSDLCWLPASSLKYFMLGFNSFWRQAVPCFLLLCRLLRFVLSETPTNMITYLPAEICMHVANRMSLTKYMQMYGRISSSNRHRWFVLCVVRRSWFPCPCFYSEPLWFDWVHWVCVLCVFVNCVLFGGPEWELWWWWHSQSQVQLWLLVKVNESTHVILMVPLTSAWTSQVVCLKEFPYIGTMLFFG